MEQVTAKQRKSRINLQYYKKPDIHSVRRKWLVLVVAMGTLAWIVTAPIRGAGRPTDVRFFQYDRLASKGPLAQPHAMWESTCKACHIEGTPINPSHWAPSLSASTSGGNNCKTCHSGPAHHAIERAQDVPSCAECHSDHRGRDTSLLAMSDAVCTRCHGNLPEHLNPDAGSPTVAASVKAFDLAQHPEFTPAQIAAAPLTGRIKFNHAVHLTKGLTLEPGGAPFTFADLDAADQARYGWTKGQKLETPVQLDCGSCHQLDGEDFARGLEPRIRALVPPRVSGATMLPVVYENHCRACHPLRFERDDRGRQIRHGLPAPGIVDEVWRLYASEAVKTNPTLLNRSLPPRPVPGPLAPPENTAAERVVTAKTLAALKLLFDSGSGGKAQTGCVKCHDLKPGAPPLVDLKAASSMAIQPVFVRSLWLESAVFDHAAHRAIECEHCHQGVHESKDQTKLLLPRIAQCVECHGPAETREGKPLGGAGVACVECHRYHGGDQPRHGIGAAVRRGEKLSLEQFLAGGAVPQSP
jgi:hypothetical protein